MVEWMWRLSWAPDTVMAVLNFKQNIFFYADSGISVAVCLQQTISLCHSVLDYSTSLTHLIILFLLSAVFTEYCMFFFFFSLEAFSIFAVCSAAWTEELHVYQLSWCIMALYAWLLIIISGSALSFHYHYTDDEGGCNVMVYYFMLDCPTVYHSVCSLVWNLQFHELTETHMNEFFQSLFITCVLFPSVLRTGQRWWLMHADTASLTLVSAVILFFDGAVGCLFHVL